jgi:Fe-S cluster biogenesis protein NfuA/nitrite reductase/ring-hydroxylating ferredoxin subunit
MSPEKNLHAVGDQIENLLQEFAVIADPRIREKAEELVRLLMELYGGALARVLQILDESGRPNEILERLAADELLASLLVLHGLHPFDVETRITRALERVRPYLGSHGGDVKLLRVMGGVVYLRLEGSCHGCPSSTITMKLAIEKAIEEAAPEVVRIEVEGESQTQPAAALGNGASHESGESHTSVSNVQSGEWFSLDDSPEFNRRNLTTAELAAMRVVVCRVGDCLYAYQDSCPACGVALRESPLQENILTCSSCGHRYDLQRAGQSIDAARFI